MSSIHQFRHATMVTNTLTSNPFTHRADSHGVTSSTCELKCIISSVLIILKYSWILVGDIPTDCYR